MIARIEHTDPATKSGEGTCRLWIDTTEKSIIALLKSRFSTRVDKVVHVGAAGTELHKYIASKVDPYHTAHWHHFFNLESCVSLHERTSYPHADGNIHRIIKDGKIFSVIDIKSNTDIAALAGQFCMDDDTFFEKVSALGWTGSKRPPVSEEFSLDSVRVAIFDELRYRGFIKGV